eukprot:246146-Pleurochrysis_carterae.AAC.1
MKPGENVIELSCNGGSEHSAQLVCNERDRGVFFNDGAVANGCSAVATQGGAGSGSSCGVSQRAGAALLDRSRLAIESSVRARRAGTPGCVGSQVARGGRGHGEWR